MLKDVSPHLQLLTPPTDRRLTLKNIFHNVLSLKKWSRTLFWPLIGTQQHTAKLNRLKRPPHQQASWRGAGRKWGPGLPLASRFRPYNPWNCIIPPDCPPICGLAEAGQLQAEFSASAPFGPGNSCTSERSGPLLDVSRISGTHPPLIVTNMSPGIAECPLGANLPPCLRTSES